jgi:transcriptional regulator with XRE-family HTH domain
MDKMSKLIKMRNNMPAKPPLIATAAAQELLKLGQQIRLHRKTLRVSAVAAAEAAGMSRVTLHRIEAGEPSVTMGAYLNAMQALGLQFGILAAQRDAPLAEAPAPKDCLPIRIRLSDYPQLKRMAWQVHGLDDLTPLEALGLYERNWRHLDLAAMDLREQHLVAALHQVFGKEIASHV